MAVDRCVGIVVDWAVQPVVAGRRNRVCEISGCLQLFKALSSQCLMGYIIEFRSEPGIASRPFG